MEGLNTARSFALHVADCVGSVIVAGVGGLVLTPPLNDILQHMHSTSMPRHTNFPKEVSYLQVTSTFAFLGLTMFTIKAIANRCLKSQSTQA